LRAGLTASSIFTGSLKLSIFDAQRSSIAGGVAIGSVANVVAQPWQALLIGAIGGVVCSFSGHFIRLFCIKNLGVHDTVGVMSMHGWPGIVGWLSGVLFLLPLDHDTLSGDNQSKDLPYIIPWENVLQHRRGDGDAAVAQLVIGPMTIAIALVTGLVAGTVAKKITSLDRHLMSPPRPALPLPPRPDVHPERVLQRASPTHISDARPAPQVQGRLLLPRPRRLPQEPRRGRGGRPQEEEEEGRRQRRRG
jgi:hypothetical protein